MAVRIFFDEDGEGGAGAGIAYSWSYICGQYRGGNLPISYPRVGNYFLPEIAFTEKTHF